MSIKKCNNLHHVFFIILSIYFLANMIRLSAEFQPILIIFLLIKNDLICLILFELFSRSVYVSTKGYYGKKRKDC